MYLNREEAIRISYLLRKKINNNLTYFEEVELNNWVTQNTQNRTLYERCLDSVEHKKAFNYLQNTNTHEAWEEVSKILDSETQKPKQNRVLHIISYVAAACVLIIGTLLLIIPSKDNEHISKSISIDYKPARNQAVIKLSNGQLITLDSNQNMVTVNENAISYSNGQEITVKDEVISAEINTPRGGYYKILLPDGTKAQLNAASSLSYPLTFSKDKREVSITGEVYFEVAPDKNKPFVVQSKHQEIKVLGTKFNVNAYDDQFHIKTSLIEGKVSVYNATNKSLTPKILTAGQQSILSKEKTIIKSIDAQSEIAWVHGKFNFDGKLLREVMRELARWYDIDVFIENDVPNIEFFGGTYRNNNLSTILSLLEQNDLKYTLSEDKKLFITKSNQEKK